MKIFAIIVVICFVSGSCATNKAPPDAVVINFEDAAQPKQKRQAAADESKIVGGVPVTIEKHPYMAHLQVMLASVVLRLCDGSILNDKYVLTAGHCLENFPTSTKISVGSQQLDGGKIVISTHYKVHPQYDKTTKDYDAAVIPASLTLDGNTAKAVVLPRAGTPLTARSVVVPGWGSTDGGNGASKVLLAVTVPVVDLSTCKTLYAGSGVAVTARMFCAGDTQKDACNNDGGSPAIAGGVQVGIVSGGKGCGDKAHPGLYTDINAVRSFITTETGL